MSLCTILAGNASAATVRQGSRLVRIVGLLLFSMTALSFLACQRIGGRTITVEFRSAAGVESGDAVYLSGIQIGEVGGSSVTNGRARVTVHIDRKHREALPGGAVFLRTQDKAKPGQSCLVGYSPRSGQANLQPQTDVYPGVSNRVELVLQFGEDVARQIWSEVVE